MTVPRPRVAVVGLGKLGAPMAACFAAGGFDVVGVDVDERSVAAVQAGKPPVQEPLLAETIARGAERLSATANLTDAVQSSDVVFVIVPTPSDDSGAFSLEYVLEACDAIGAALADGRYRLIAITSTVMPGSVDGPIRSSLERASGLRAGEDFGLCYSPEFIALGSVIRDFLNPDFLLIGESDQRAGDVLSDLYRQVCDNDAPIARMNFVNAELAKIAVNTYVTTKITFANMLARMCERLPEADVDTVTSALGLDSRIGPRYLRGGIGYGGPCFPRDNVALAALARSLGVSALLAEATDQANREHTGQLADLVEEITQDGALVAVLGLAYKPGTNVVDESPGLQLVHHLARRGLDVVAHDPVAVAGARHASEGIPVRFETDLSTVVENADTFVVMTAWPEYRALPALLEGRRRSCTIVDGWRMLEPLAAGNALVSHVVLGAGPPAAQLVNHSAR